MNKRPDLNKAPLPDFNSPGCSITMNVGQWDLLLDEAYKMGWTLIEMDDNEKPVAAYRKAAAQ